MGNDNSKERNVNGGTGRSTRAHSRSPAPHTQTQTAPSSPALGPAAVANGGPSRTASPPSSSKGTAASASPAPVKGTRAWWSGSHLHLPPLLEVLHLQNQGMRLRECRGMLRALADHKSVRVINLAANPGLGNEGLELIGAMFAHDSLIEILDLSACDVSDKGVSYLARAIASNPKLALVDLRLAFNRLTDASCAMLADCVKHNATLMRIDCRNNPLITANGHYILQCMRSRPALVAAGKARSEPLLSPDPVSPMDSSVPQVQLTDAACINKRTTGTGAGTGTGTGTNQQQQHSANSAHTSPSHAPQRLQHHHSHSACDTVSSSSSAPHAASSAAASSLAHSASPATFFSPSHSGLHADSDTFSAPSSPMSPLAISCTGLANHTALYASPSQSPSGSSAPSNGLNGSALDFAAPAPSAPGSVSQPQAQSQARSRKALAKQAELASHSQSLSAELEAQLSVLRAQPPELVSSQLLERVFLLLRRDDTQMARFVELSVAFRQGVLPVSSFYTYALETLKFSGVRACAPAMIVALAAAPGPQAQLHRAHVEYLCVKAMLAERREETGQTAHTQTQTQTQQPSGLAREGAPLRSGSGSGSGADTPGGTHDGLAPIEIAFAGVPTASPEGQTPFVPEFPSEQASAASTPLPHSTGMADALPQFLVAPLAQAQAQAQAQVHPVQSAVTGHTDPAAQSTTAEPLVARAPSDCDGTTRRRKTSRAETPPQPQNDAPTSSAGAIAQPATAAPSPALAPADSAPAASVTVPSTPSPAPTPTPPPAATPAEEAVDATSVHARFMQDKLARAAAAAAAKEEAQRKEAAAAEQKRLKEEAAAEARRLKEEAAAQKKAADAARRAEEVARRAEEARKKDEIAAAKRAAADAERARREAEKAEKAEAARQAREAEEARKAAAIAEAQRQEEERRQAFEAARRARLEAEEAEEARVAAEALRQAELERAAEAEAARKRARREAREAEKREAAAAAAAAEQEEAARISAAEEAAATRKREKEAEKAARRREAESATAAATSERITLLEEAEALSRLDSERAAADAAEAKKRRKEEKKAKKAAKEAKEKEKEKEKERASAHSASHTSGPPPPPPAYPSSFGNNWNAPSQQQAGVELDVPAQVAAWAQRYTAQLPPIHLPPVPPPMPAVEGATASSDKFIPYEEEVKQKRAEAAARARVAALHAAYAQAQADAAKRDRDQANIKADVAALLLNLHAVFPQLGEDGRPKSGPYPFAESLQSDRSPAAIKKAFLKASVQVHPDKQAKSDAKRVQLSSCIFPILRDAYQHFVSINKL